MKKIVLLMSLLVFFLTPFFVFAQQESIPVDSGQDVFFRAEVIEVMNEETNMMPDGTEVRQQNLLLRGLEGDFKDKEVEFNGIGPLNVLSKNIYKAGDKVLAVASFDADGNAVYYITDYVRSKSLWLIAILFVLALIIVGRIKGIRSLLALVLTFFVIIKYIIPRILGGGSPLVATFIGSIIILLIIIYVTEGFRARSHISIISILFSLIITILLSWIFVSITKLTGAASEDILFLLNIGGQAINFKGLLLAGVIIGALGVLDDVVISQVATVEQIIKANNSLGKKQVFRHAYKVGISHIASMANTLFLAYAGVSLPLLILFVSGESAFTGWGQAINSEIIATEVVRTLAGSIGLVLSVPIATYIAAKWYKRNSPGS